MVTFAVKTWLRVKGTDEGWSVFGLYTYGGQSVTSWGSKWWYLLNDITQWAFIRLQVA